MKKMEKILSMMFILMMILLQQKKAFIGCTIDKVKETYGEDYKEESGMYTYTKEGTRLMFLTQENIVTSIEYSGLTE